MEHERATDQVPTLEDFWREDQIAVGRATHEAWRERLESLGYADHKSSPRYSNNPLYRDDAQCAGCHERYGDGNRYSKKQHHSHAVAWEALTPEAQMSYILQAQAGYVLGFARAMAHRAGVEPTVPDATPPPPTRHGFVRSPLRQQGKPTYSPDICWFTVPNAEVDPSGPTLTDRLSICGRPPSEHVGG